MGMACPVGLTAASAYAAVRGGINRFQELPYCDERGQVLTGSVFAPLGETAEACERWIPLLRCALADALSGTPALPADWHVMLALPTRTGTTLTAPNFDRCLEKCADWLGPALRCDRVHVLAGGPCMGYRAIAAARAVLNENRARSVLVAAADSLIAARPLLALSRQRRLLTEENPDGLMPGEAAAALVLTRRAATPLGAILGLGFGTEPSQVDNDVPLRGQGIVDAARVALAECALALHDVDVRLSDAAGESFHFREQVLAVTRLLRRNKDSFPLWRVARSLGHTGAAAGICNLVIALSAAQTGRFPGNRAIAYAGDDEGARAALILEPALPRG